LEGIQGPGVQSGDSREADGYSEEDSQVVPWFSVGNLNNQQGDETWENIQGVGGYLEDSQKVGEDWEGILAGFLLVIVGNWVKTQGEVGFLLEIV